VNVDAARDRAKLHRQLLDGLEETGMFFTTAQRGRVVVADLLEALVELEAERTARVQLQERVEQQETLLRRVAARVMFSPEAAAEFETFEFAPAVPKVADLSTGARRSARAAVERRIGQLQGILVKLSDSEASPT
jgi:hypothetical protein